MQQMLSLKGKTLPIKYTLSLQDYEGYLHLDDLSQHATSSYKDSIALW